MSAAFHRPRWRRLLRGSRRRPDRGSPGVERSASAVCPRFASGQATVELVAILPVAIVVGLAVGQLLAAGAARELAGNAAAAGAAALLQGLDAPQAAREALPGSSRDRVDIEISGRRVRVRVRPVAILPLLADELAATVTADAGPESPEASVR